MMELTLMLALDLCRLPDCPGAPAPRAEAGVCSGCGARLLKAAAAFMTSDGDVRLVDGQDVLIDRGQVLASEKASLGAVREFEDRIEVNLAVVGALCGMEPSVPDALRVRLPERTSKKVVVREVRSSPAGTSSVRVLATLSPR